MVRVEQATEIIHSQVIDLTTQTVALTEALGRVLAAPLSADRDLPPFNRTTMDGIAISYAAYESGIRNFHIQATQAAGDQPVEISQPHQCIEIMTGSALPASTDTVVPYEDLLVTGKDITISAVVQKGQNIHRRGKDSRQGETLVPANRSVTPAIVAVAASTGRARLNVKKLPATVIISTGDELVEIGQAPSPYQIRRSNNYMIAAVLQEYCLLADMVHIADDPGAVQSGLSSCLDAYEVIILTGGVSMGKFDYVPEALRALQVEELFYKVQQRPGKPFWFGRHLSGKLVFAFPGNPVSTFLCLQRYFLPWLTASLGLEPVPPLHAALASPLRFTPALQYFLQVQLRMNEQGRLLASPAEGNGSGDFSNLLSTNAFMELPAAQVDFREGEVFRVWPYKQFLP